MQVLFQEIDIIELYRTGTDSEGIPIADGDDSLFYMDPKTAKVYLRKELDYERQTTYAINIQVTDNGIPLRRSSTSVINVYVKDVNDNPPVCNPI